MVSMTTRRWRRATAAVLCCVVAGVHPLGAQSDVRLRAGRLVERIETVIDSTQTYAFYLPSGYAPDHAPPVLFVMDPRGRALRALERFRPAAEELGWIVASSHNTASDVPEDRNTPAFNAMLDDVQRRVAIDPRRLYLAGFSGTAESSWYIALAMSGHVAGIVAAGYGLPYEIHVRMEAADAVPTFAVYGTAGRTGFNYEGVHDMDGALDAAGVPHRVSYFEGGHEWMPAGLARDAVRWLEIRAMRTGLRRPDADFIASELTALMERTDALVAEGRTLEAVALLDGAGLDFPESAAGLGGLRDHLADTDAYRTESVRRVRESLEASDYSDLLRARFGGRSGDGPRIDPVDLARELRVPELLERSRAEDPDEALQARRLLASASVLLSFYGPRAALTKGSAGHVLDLLEVAEMIQPGNVGLCRFRAFAHAQLRNTTAALDALRCWTDRARPSPEALESEPYLEPLRGEAGFEALLRELRGG